jgi:hypothetical protein
LHPPSPSIKPPADDAVGIGGVTAAREAKGAGDLGDVREVGGGCTGTGIRGTGSSFLQRWRQETIFLGFGKSNFSQSPRCHYCWWP